MITVYQIWPTNTQIDAFNDGASIPCIEVLRQLMFGSKKFTPDMLQYFVPVYEVDTDDLDQAFEVTNLWDNRVPVRALHKNPLGRSTSVGDIFQLGDQFYMVEPFGFEELRLFKDEIETIGKAA